MKNKFLVLSKSVIEGLISEEIDAIFNLIKDAYLLYADGLAQNPPSYFLRFEHKPNSRIIALPSYLGGNFNFAGIKWISSFPDNIKKGFQRASAAFILNDAEAGYPLACMESSYISALRTSVSAVMVAEKLHDKFNDKSICIVGTGHISRNILSVFNKTKWNFKEIFLFDLNKDDAVKFRENMPYSKDNCIIEDNIESAILKADTVVFATTALQPYLKNPELFTNGQVVLHVSLRDLSPEIIAKHENYVDDIEHILQADTSVDLASKQFKHHDFIVGTISDIIKSPIDKNPFKADIFSPMGMGMLDLAVASFVYNKAVEEGVGVIVDDFFGDISR